MTGTPYRLAVVLFASVAGTAPISAEQGGPADGGGAQQVPVLEKKDAPEWRLSAGVDYRFRFKADLRMDAARYRSAFPSFAAPQNDYPSRDAVLERLGSGAEGDARRDYDNGFVAPDSGGGGITWNWSADSAAQYDAAAGTLAFDGIYGVTESRLGSVNAPGVGDDVDLCGVSLDLARELWRDGRFSLGVSLGGSYLPERELLSARQSFAAGSVRSEVWRVRDTYDVSWWGGETPEANVSGGLGSGTFDGPGPLIPYSPSSRTDEQVEVLADETFDGGAWVDADVWLAEGRACLTPEWQVLDRLSLLGNLGVAVEYVEVATRSGAWMSQNATQRSYRSSSSDGEWVVQAVLGVGARLAVTDRIGLSVMGEARLPRTTIDIEADPYEGEVELGTWSVGTQVDYCF